LLWVSRPSWSISNTTDTVLYLYYDNSHADNTSYVGQVGSTPGKAVWDSSYKAVYHMNDNPDATHIKDSTTNSNNGTKYSASVETNGQVGKAQSFDGVDDYIQIPNSTSLTMSSGLSVEALVEPTYTTTHTSNQWRIVTKMSYPNSGYYLDSRNDRVTYFSTYDGSGHTNVSTALPLNQWSLVSGTSDGTTNKIYLNGTQQDSDPSGTLTNSTASLYISGQGDYSWKGLIDEVRLSSVTRSADWIKATSYTLKDNFVSYGSEETTFFNTQYAWDAGGNMAQRQNTVSGETETFAYDTLDRLTGVTGAYSESYTYDAIGNLTSKNGTSTL
jgi:hypothetical protein